MKKSYVYKITCKITGEYYFGSSFRAKRDSYWGTGIKIKDRIAQYGKENFIKEILGEFNDRVEAHKKENQYIEKFRHDDKCLNERLEHKFGLYSEESRTKLSAALRGKTFSEEHKAKMSAAQRGKIVSDDTRARISAAQRGKTFSEEHKARISAALRGKTFSEEHRAKIGAAKLGEKNPNFGKHLSEETRSKISATERGKIVSDEARAKISAAMRGKKSPWYGKHWRKNPVTGKREWYE